MKTGNESTGAKSRYSVDVQSFLIVLAVAVLLQLGYAFASPTVARAAMLSYSCTGPHCYGTSVWSSTSYYGGSTNISVVNLSCTPSVCGLDAGAVDNEMWLDGKVGQTTYWVEAGYSTYSTDHTTTIDYFWADSRPCCGYAEHVEGQVPSGDFGHNTSFQVYSLCCQEFQVEIYSPSVTYNGTSTSNSMAPSDVKIGQELSGASGTGGASAPTANFTDNAHWDSSNNRHYFTTEGIDNANNPPYVSWAIPPNGSNNGGEFQTHCC